MSVRSSDVARTRSSEGPSIFNHSGIASVFADENGDFERSACELKCRPGQLILKRHIDAALTQSGSCLLWTQLAVEVGHLG